MSESAKKRRVSKRRSSFAAGRAKLQQSGAFGGDLYKSIDADKPPDERLALLTKACLQYTLQKMEEESTDIEDFQSLKKELEEAVLYQVAEMEEAGVFKRATKNQRCLPNPINLEMDQTIIEVEDRIKRLDDEVVAWDELLNRLDREADESQKKERDVMEADIPFYIKKLGEEWMVPKMDYNSMLSDLDKDMKVTKFHINKFCNATKTLQRTCLTAGKILNIQIPKLQKEVFQVTASADTPRRMIERITTLPS
ncbi:uncharacterized protein LOC110464892 [Mizuhopecten yessoensis]|uniref:Uncharacterized protein n=1 Tax=Mizuhopecten yessoensis TaxID=6573 RepID=A0A210PSX8_MIZYE|nr:uncharacterized protein LOC110464892 [Mizuhopecten yessoensis]XP_021376029.1 uncharacterized protein LOC110464892 [Mizuhopecten yessoensis]XP_021376030.1 uncharacterized protein LOC110464892 [Mizuhopecten yessoensis]XP_021376031.1 uncharacterized protein LOC110464892 [Mizuhopecten yessoensis]OWF39556.1 hypothetical protein KP79_PYT03942 [Mizuhopecten yessoensis]